MSLARVRLTTYPTTPLSYLCVGLREMAAVNYSKWPIPARSSKSYTPKGQNSVGRGNKSVSCWPYLSAREQIGINRRWRRCRFFRTRRVCDCPGFGDSKFIPESKCENVCSLGDTGICFGAYLSLIKTSHCKFVVGSAKCGGQFRSLSLPTSVSWTDLLRSVKVLA